MALAPAPARSAGAWLALATVFAGGLNYGYTLVLTALLPAAGYAVFAGGQALLLVAGTVANAALPWVLAHELARDGADARARAEVVWFAVLVNGLQGLLAAALVMAVSSSFASGLALAVLGASSLGFFAASTAIGWAQGMGRFRLLALFLTAEVAIKVLAGLALVAFGAGVAGALAGTLVGTVAVAGWGAWVMRADLVPSRAAVRVLRLWRGALGMVGVQALVTVAAAADVVLVVSLLPAGPDVAAYQVATTLGRVPLFLAMALSMAAFGALSRAPGDRRLISESASALLCLAVALAVAGMTVPPELVALVLPAGYEGTAGFLVLTAPTGALLALITLQASWFKAAQRFKACLVVLLGGTLATAGCIVAGAELGGVEGLGLGALAGAVGLSAALGLLGERLWPGAQRPDLRPALLAALAGVPLVFLGEQPIVWAALAAVLVLGAAWVAFGPSSAPSPRRSA